MGGCMAPEIMGAQIDSNHFARLVDHHPSSIVSNREYMLPRFNPFILLDGFENLLSGEISNRVAK